MGRRIGRRLASGELVGRAAELAYFFLLSLFPLLLFATALVGRYFEEGTALRESLFRYFEAVVPNQAALDLIRGTLDEIAANRGGKLSLAALLWVVLASQGVTAVGRALHAWSIRESRRPFWLRQLLAIGITTAFVGLLLTALFLLFEGGAVVEWIADRYSVGVAVTVVWNWLRWPLLLAFVLFAFELLYKLAPTGLRGRGLAWFTPGAVCGVALWLLASQGFRFYLTRFDLYSLVYGSLGAVIVLLLWLYLTAVAILLGSEVNAGIRSSILDE